MIKDSLKRIWILSKKNISLYIKKGPVLIFGLMFPFFMTLSWVIGREISFNQVFIGIISMTSFFTEIRKFDKNVSLINSVFLKYSGIEDIHLELEDMRKLNIKGINVNYNFANFEVFKRIKEHGFKFCVWGVLFKRSMKKFLIMKYNGEYIDAIMSNQPDRLVKFRNEFQN
ncbi:unnamed protein product [marine sediment metagenome]|uniref:Uncharacterized protein n=1 Tax=marine sediment metagenome TaxID=412755 RepID=X1BLQ1_9ZZZZ